MTEKDLIEKIQKLKQIRPREEWVFLTKSQILEEEKSLSEKWSLPVLTWNYVTSVIRTVLSPRPILKPLLVVLVMTILAVGFAFHFTGDETTVVVEDEISDNLAEIERLTSVLKQARLDISQVVADFKEITKTDQVLVSGRMADITIETGEAVIEQAKKIEEKITKNGKEDSQVLAMMMSAEITEFEDTLVKARSSLNNHYAFISEVEIRNLENILTPDQQVLRKLLKQARQHFDRGEYDQSLMIVHKIYQIMYLQ